MKQEIVIIEDNPDDAELIQLAFSKINKNWILTHFFDGNKALAYMFENSAGHHSILSLILLDLKLDGSSGFDVLRELRRNVRTLYIPVVIFTSSGLGADMIQSYRLGANCFVQKPVDGNIFFKSLSSLGDFWMNINDFPKLKQTTHE